ncbi:hypothetical protein ACPCBF_13760 [Streptomyces pseudogriseolus]|uniref:hypothetical protein n=1 Tax=Streptomyces pseudogriseolus TaxID=36817 RepID=UPI003491550B
MEIQDYRLDPVVRALSMRSLTALLGLLDDHRFARGVKPTDEQPRRVMVQRLKSELPQTWNDKPRFPRRVPHASEVRYADEAAPAPRIRVLRPLIHSRTSG